MKIVGYILAVAFALAGAILLGWCIISVCDIAINMGAMWAYNFFEIMR